MIVQESLNVTLKNSEPVLRTRSDTEALAVRRSSVSLDVSTVAPAGCKRIAADLFVPRVPVRRLCCGSVFLAVA